MKSKINIKGGATRNNSKQFKLLHLLIQNLPQNSLKSHGPSPQCPYKSCTSTHPGLTQSVTDLALPHQYSIHHNFELPISHRATPWAGFVWCIRHGTGYKYKCIQVNKIITHIFTTETHTVSNAKSAKKIMHWKWETAHSTTSPKQMAKSFL